MRNKNYCTVWILTSGTQINNGFQPFVLAQNLIVKGRVKILISIFCHNIIMKKIGARTFF